MINWTGCWKLLIIIDTLILNLYTCVPLDGPKLLKGNGIALLSCIVSVFVCEHS